MKVKGIIDIDLVNYKKACMTIMMPYCNFKCGKDICQNNELAAAPIVDIADDKIIQLYLNNPITEAICFQGLEPMDSFDELINFIEKFKERFYYQTVDLDTNAIYTATIGNPPDIIIYTGYTKNELEEKGYLTKLKKYDKIIIKYGRYIPNQEPHRDEVLGINLASDNQYAERIN